MKQFFYSKPNHCYNCGGQTKTKFWISDQFFCRKCYLDIKRTKKVKKDKPFNYEVGCSYNHPYVGKLLVLGIRSCKCPYRPGCVGELRSRLTSGRETNVCGFEGTDPIMKLVQKEEVFRFKVVK